jgi:hypothetical protein
MTWAVLKIRAIVLVALASLAVGHAAADPPDVLRHYRFIPSRSIVHQTGGFAGFDITHHVYGQFDLVTGYEYGVDPPSLMPFAKFENVDAWLVPNGPLLFVLDLDRTLNLSGLEGTFTEPNRLFFRGEDGQGAPFRLQATIAGRLIHLVGANDPPCCDFFNYTINAYAHLAPFADFNFDGSVDAADYTAWRDHLGMSSGATLEQGDADGDGDVDGDDFLAWQQDVGMVIDMNALDAGGLGSAAVPEPATFALLVTGVLLLQSWSLYGQRC